eukprot:1341175-Amorphochlora_amoeboformis.AAC.1
MGRHSGSRLLMARSVALACVIAAFIQIFQGKMLLRHKGTPSRTKFRGNFAPESRNLRAKGRGCHARSEWLPQRVPQV